jgi:hypothetical protein
MAHPQFNNLLLYINNELQNDNKKFITYTYVIKGLKHFNLVQYINGVMQSM